MSESPKHQLNALGAREFLSRYRGLRIKPSRDGVLLIAGELEYCAQDDRGTAHCDSFLIELRIPEAFPAVLPDVRETGGRIPRHFHHNSDGTLCLGSPLKLRLRLGTERTLTAFVERCVIPYLYGFIEFTRTGTLPFGELAHASAGLFDEYRALLNVKDDAACVNLLFLAGVKKRIANKAPCPCGGGKRLGRCHHRQVNYLRRFGSRAWYRGHAGYMSRFLQAS